MFIEQLNVQKQFYQYLYAQYVLVVANNNFIIVSMVKKPNFILIINTITNLRGRGSQCRYLLFLVVLIEKSSSYGIKNIVRSRSYRIFKIGNIHIITLDAQTLIASYMDTFKSHCEKTISFYF